MPIVYESASKGGGSGTVTSVTAADTSIVIAGTATDPTVKTGTLDVIAADHPPAADWSNNSHKITGLANGTAATDAAAFGQIPVGGTGLVKLFESTLGVDTASIDTGANGIAAGHRDLLVLILARTADAGATGSINVTVNNDTGNNYDDEHIFGSGSTASASFKVANPNWTTLVHGSGGSSGYPGLWRLNIPSYDQTTFWKVAEMQFSIPDATSGNEFTGTFSLGWRSTAAINRMTVTGATANLKAGSRLVIYGAQ